MCDRTQIHLFLCPQQFYLLLTVSERYFSSSLFDHSFFIRVQFCNVVSYKSTFTCTWCLGRTVFRDNHYENTPIHIYWKFYNQKKKENFQIKNSDIFHISAQNIDCGYSLEPPRRGGSNEYPQSVFSSRNKKNNVYPCKLQFSCIKVGFKGVKII